MPSPHTGRILIMSSSIFQLVPRNCLLGTSNPCLLHVNAACKQVSGDQDTGRSRAELAHHEVSLLLAGQLRTDWSADHQCPTVDGQNHEPP